MEQRALCVPLAAATSGRCLAGSWDHHVHLTLTPSPKRRLWSRLIVALVTVVALPCTAATTCTTTATAVAFGLYNPLIGTPNNTTGSVSVRCQMVANLFDRVDYTVALSAGSSGSYVNRTLRSGINTLNYNLFIDAALSQVWGVNGGATAARSGTMSLFFFAPTAQSDLTIYGSIPAGQYNAVPGSYNDTITVTVTY
jgi:spore coat protein U-like protein